MKKRRVVLRALLLSALLLSWLCLCSFTESESALAEEAGVSTLSHPAITEDELQGDAPILLQDKLGELLQSGAAEALQSASGSFASLLAVLLLCSLLHALQKLSESETLDTACCFLTALAISGVSYRLLAGVFETAQTALSLFAQYLTALLPVSASLLVSGGNPSVAATSSATFSVFLSAIGILSAQVLLPFLQASFSIGFATALPGSANLSPIGSLLRNTCSILLAFLFSLLSFLLSMQSSISAATDSMVFRSVRFASGVFIPVIGGVLGEAARTVAGSISVIKGAVGGVGTVVTLSILLPPFLLAAFHKLLLSVCSALAKLLCCEKEAAFLSELGSTLSVLLGLLAGAEVTALLYLASFIRIGTG